MPTTIAGLAPPEGTLTVTVSPGGANELTEVVLDPDVRLLTLDPDGVDMRLQWEGVEGQAGEDLISVRIRTGGPTEIDCPGWGNDGARVYLYCATPSTDCILLAQRGRAE